MSSTASSIWDTIVVGLGGVGSAALAHLAARGQRVLGLEQFSCGHTRGSSHGHSRVIRQAYFEHPDYVPLLLRSYDLWEQLERNTDTHLLHRIGLVQLGPAEGVVIQGVLRSAAEHQLAVDQFEPPEVRARYPALNVRDDWAAVFEPNAGYLFVEQAVRAHQTWAARAGATIREHETVRSWSATDRGITVTTDIATWTAGAVVFAAGPWTQPLVAELGQRLRVLRKDLHWFVANPLCKPEAGMPIFLYELDDGIFYGFPDVDGVGVKVGEHTGGVECAAPGPPPFDVLKLDVARVERFVTEYLPQVTTRRLRHRVCWYTMSADGHFLVGAHPQHPNTFVAAGLSGHGFKFTPVLGELLAELVCEGQTALPAEFLRVDRQRA